MKDAASADEDAVAHLDVPGQEHVIRQDDVIAQMRVVPQMRARHQKTVVADDRRAAGRGAAVDRAVLADRVPVPDLHAALCGRVEGEILRPAADHRAVADAVFRAQPHVPGEHRVRLNHAARTDDGGTLNADVRADDSIVGNPGGGIDDGSWMDHLTWPPLP